MLLPFTETKKTVLRATDSTLSAQQILEQAGFSRMPSAKVLRESHSEKLSAQFAVEWRRKATVAGLVSLHHLDTNGQHVQASLLLEDDAVRALQEEVTLLTVNYAFAMWNIRKVYFWTTKATAEELSLAPSLVRKEATLTDYVRDGDRLRDMHVFAVYRTQWLDRGLKALNRIMELPEDADIVAAGVGGGGRA